MNLKRCDKGHFYDVDKFATCPHCSGESENMEATVKYNEQEGVSRFDLDHTVAYGNNDSADVYSVLQDTVPDTGNTLSELMKKLNGETVSDDAEEDMDVTQRYTPGDLKIEPTVGWLTAITGENAGKSFVLKAGRNFIGRSSSMDVVLAGDKSISREKHAIVLYEPRKREFLVQPGESKELFYVNDEVVVSTIKLQAYDKLLLGSTTLIFVPLCGEYFSWDDEKNE